MSPRSPRGNSSTSKLPAVRPRKPSTSRSNPPPPFTPAPNDTKRSPSSATSVSGTWKTCGASVLSASRPAQPPNASRWRPTWPCSTACESPSRKGPFSACACSPPNWRQAVNGKTWPAARSPNNTCGTTWPAGPPPAQNYPRSRAVHRSIRPPRPGREVRGATVAEDVSGGNTYEKTPCDAVLQCPTVDIPRPRQFRGGRPSDPAGIPGDSGPVQVRPHERTSSQSRPRTPLPPRSRGIAAENGSCIGDDYG